MSQDLIAVIDIGKTNAKLILVDTQSGETRWCLERPSPALRRSPFRELDVGGIEEWLLSALASAPGKKQIRALVSVAHGAAAVLISPAGKILAAPDYEDPVFEAVSDAYRELRDPFDLTFSPFLPLGLNLGRQLYYLQQMQPNLLHSCDALLLYPQYWAWRLSGVRASEITSLGCHSDLWRPRLGRISSLTRNQGWVALLPPMRAAGDVLGTVSRRVIQITGLDAQCNVLCGIHDSNASYLCYRVGHPAGQPFAVVSSGTWTVIMAHGSDLARLRENRDMLVNVDAFGVPVATARFMGGHEYEAIAGTSQASKQPTFGSFKCVIRRQAMALPSFANAGGPFAGQKGKLVNAEGLNDVERGALATLYCALKTDLLLDWLGVSGAVIVDGPLAANPLYGSLLATLRLGSSVFLGDSRSGSAQCARILCSHVPTLQLREARTFHCAELEAYRTQWRFRSA
jgi:L-fuculokinase